MGQDGLEYGMQSKGLDHDVYNGEWEQFVQEFKLTEPQPEPETMWVDDFVIEEQKRIMNVLNAPSPAATSAFAIGRAIVAKLDASGGEN